MAIIPDPLDFQTSTTEEDRGRKKRGVFSNLQEARKIYKNFEKTIKYARAAASTINPAIIIPVVVFSLIFFIIIFDVQNTAGLSGGGSKDSSTTAGGGSQGVPSIPGFNIDIEGPQEEANGAILKYTVTISHNPSIAPPLANIEVYDALPSGARLVDTTGVLKAPGSSPNVWALSEPANQTRFEIRVQPNQSDAYFDYTVSARSLATSPGTGAPPTADNCNGAYDLTKWPSKNPLNANYGDPSCNLTRNDLYTLLKQLDPTYADVWYQMASCETGGTYSPNSFNGASTSGTAWGLFQMGHEAYPDLGIPLQMNNQYDRGDVEWTIQASNAINYNKQRGNDFAYWGCSPF